MYFFSVLKKTNLLSKPFCQAQVEDKHFDYLQGQFLAWRVVYEQNFCFLLATGLSMLFPSISIRLFNIFPSYVKVIETHSRACKET